MAALQSTDSQTLERNVRVSKKLAERSILLSATLLILSPVPLLISRTLSDVSAGAMLSSMLLLFVYDYGIRREHKLRQRLNRLRAHDDAREYFLCLRSFNRSESQLITRSAGPVNPLPDALIVDNVVEELAEALKNHGVLFFIGSRSRFDPWSEPDVILLTDVSDEWRDAFGILASGAKAIFLIPETTAGLLEEMTLVSRNGLIGKTIFIMAPSTGYDSRRDDWTRMKSRLASRGWVLPEYREEGMVYLADHAFSPTYSVPYVSGRRRSLGDAVENLIARLTSGVSVRDVIPDVLSKERA